MQIFACYSMYKKNTFLINWIMIKRQETYKNIYNVYIYTFFAAQIQMKICSERSTTMFLIVQCLMI
jgi:hypothetical protein